MSRRWASSASRSCAERHLLPLRRDRGVPRLDLDHRQVGAREALEHGHWLPVRIREQMTEDLPGGPLARGVRLVQVRLHALELRSEIRRRRVALLLQLDDCRSGHWLAPCWCEPSSVQISARGLRL